MGACWERGVLSSRESVIIKKSFMFFPGIKGVLKGFSVFLCWLPASITKVRKYKTCLKNVPCGNPSRGQSEEEVWPGRCESAVFSISFTRASGYRAQSFFLAPGANSSLLCKKHWVGHEGPALMSRQEGIQLPRRWRFWNRAFGGQSAGTTSTSQTTTG